MGVQKREIKSLMRLGSFYLSSPNILGCYFNPKIL